MLGFDDQVSNEEDGRPVGKVLRFPISGLPSIKRRKEEVLEQISSAASGVQPSADRDSSPDYEERRPGRVRRVSFGSLQWQYGWDVMRQPRRLEREQRLEPMELPTFQRVEEDQEYLIQRGTMERIKFLRTEEAKEFDRRRDLMKISAELLSKEDELLAKLTELQKEKRRCNTALSDVLNSIDGHRARMHLAAQAEGLEAREELEKERKKHMCRICKINSRDALILPCSHFLYCGQCLQKLQKVTNECPTCQGPIADFLLCKLTAD